jgi:hypothetical protein
MFIACSDTGQTTQPITHTSETSITTTVTQTATLSTGTPTQTATVTPTSSVGTPTQTTTAPTVTSTTTTTGGISTTIIYFYQAIENKNYTRAYSYISSDATTTDGQKLTKDAFLQLAQLGDADGVVTSFDYIADSTDATQITMTIMRGSSLRYHAHLHMKEKGNVWQIVQLDRI